MREALHCLGAGEVPKPCCERWTIAEKKHGRRELSLAKPWNGVTLEPSPGAAVETLVRTPQGAPLVVEGRAGRGRIVVTAFRLSERALLNWPHFDGFVNETDLNLVSANFSTSQFAASRGDLNFDGIVNNADLNLIQTHWQSIIPYELVVIGIAPLAATLGTVTITNNYNYTGNSTIAAGTLMIGNGGTPTT